MLLAPGLHSSLAQLLLLLGQYPCRMCLAPIRLSGATTSPSLLEQSAMENTKVYLGLFAVWAMVAWMAWEFAWDAWQNARRNKRQRPPSLNE